MERRSKHLPTNALLYKKKAVTKHQARLLKKTTLLVGDIIQRYDMKPLWRKQVKKKHVKKQLKQLRVTADR